MEIYTLVREVFKFNRLFFITASLLILSCQKQHEEIIPVEKPDQFTIERIKVAEDRHLMNLLNSFQQYARVNSKTLDTDVGELDTTEAIKVIDPENNVINYTLTLTGGSSQDSIASFENFIIEEKMGLLRNIS